LVFVHCTSVAAVVNWRGRVIVAAFLVFNVQYSSVRYCREQRGMWDEECKWCRARTTPPCNFHSTIVLCTIRWSAPNMKTLTLSYSHDIASNLDNSCSLSVVTKTAFQNLGLRGHLALPAQPRRPQPHPRSTELMHEFLCVIEQVHSLQKSGTIPPSCATHH
jgi:hypothetical protein